MQGAIWASVGNPAAYVSLDPPRYRIPKAIFPTLDQERKVFR
jgi:hypothetical protein